MVRAMVGFTIHVWLFTIGYGRLWLVYGRLWFEDRDLEIRVSGIKSGTPVSYIPKIPNVPSPNSPRGRDFFGMLGAG